MAKSKPPKNPHDGRRNNRPPVAGQIARGEIRNPYGAAGKPKPEPPTSIESIYISESERIVSRDENGDVNAGRRLVQDEFHDALVQRDPKVRDRLLRQLAAARAKEGQQWAEFEAWFLARKADYKDEFYLAEVTGREPPDVAHPDHVSLIDRRLVLTGPLERRERQAWERLKGDIKLAAWFHARARANFQLDPREETWTTLELVKIYRRRLMRRVPKGWNWREEIYCCGSQTKRVQECIAEMEEDLCVRTQN